VENLEDKIRTVHAYRTTLLDRIFDELRRRSPTCASGLRCAPRSFLCLKHSKQKTGSFTAMLSRAVHWQNWGLPGTIQLMDPNLISRVMQEMGRKGGKTP
jgi:hypothetical protein